MAGEGKGKKGTEGRKGREGMGGGKGGERREGRGLQKKEKAWEEEMRGKRREQRKGDWEE